MSKIAWLLNKTPASFARWFRSDRLVSRLTRPLVNRLVPADETLITIRSGAAAGMKLVIDPRHEKFYWTGAREQAVQDVLVETLRAGSCFWDVGAHIGFFSLIGARCGGPTGRAYAFEPSRENRERLDRVLALNHVTTVSVIPVAVSAADEVGLIYSHSSSTMWSLQPGRGHAPAYDVQCRSLDSLFAAGEVEPPDVIKIDVEGVEVDVLRGALTVIRTVRPTMVVEFSTIELLEQARGLLPELEFRQLDDSRWLLR